MMLNLRYLFQQLLQNIYIREMKRSIPSYSNSQYSTTIKNHLYSNCTDVKIQDQYLINLLTMNPGYTIQPPAQQIIRNRMQCNGLTICYNGTQLKWNGYIDLRALQAPLRDLIILGQNWVEVYPEQNNGRKFYKPPMGSQLNRTCIAKFQSYYRVNKKKLEQLCAKQNNLQLLSISEDGHEYVIQIPHFTKYQFDFAMDEQNGTPPVTPIVINGQQGDTDDNSDNLVAFLLDKYRKKEIEQKQKKIQRQAMNKQYIMAILQSHLNNFKEIKPIDPSSKLIGQVLQFNSRRSSIKNNMTSQSNLPGTINPYGSNISFKSVSIPNKSQYINFPPKYITPNSTCTSQYKKILKLIEKPANLSSYILDTEGIELRIRQCLALYCICFRYYYCHFKFIRDAQTKRMEVQYDKYCKTSGNYNQQQMFKDCMEWIVREAYQSGKINLPDNPIYKKMSVRMNDELVQSLLEFDKYEQAEFVSNIEDQYYRAGYMNPFNICHQLQEIINNNGNLILNEHWLIRYSMYLWYYDPNAPGFLQKLSTVLRAKQSYFKIELYLLRLYQLQLLKRAPHPHPGSGAIRVDNRRQGGVIQYPIGDQVSEGWTWYFSNSLIKQELKSCEGHGQRLQILNYNKYRYLLLKKVTKNCINQLLSNPSALDNYSTIKELFLYENYVPQTHKQHLINDILTEYSNCSSLKFDLVISNHQRGAQFMIRRKHAIQCYTNGKYLDALIHITKIYQMYMGNINDVVDDWKELEIIVLDIIGREEVMLSFVHQNLMALLQSVKKIMHSLSNTINQPFKQFLQNYLLFLELKINKSTLQINIQLCNNLLNFSESFQCPSIKKQITQVIYRYIREHKQIIKKLPQLNKAAEKGKNKSENQRQKIQQSLYKRLLQIYENDLERCMEIKLARLSR